MKRVLVVLALSGCAAGGSSSMVGRWRARRIVDSTACVQTQAPGAGCEKLITIGRDLPARSFSSLMFVFPASGYMQQRGNGEVGHGVTFDSYFEYVRGRGGFALGARVGAEAANGFGDKIYLLTPVSVVGHAGGLWGSVYVGGGYSPVAVQSQSVGEGEMKTTLPAEYHHNSVHVFAGTRFWLRRTLERGLSFNPEFRIQTFGDTTLTSLSGNLGLHF
jgi:hypothetical protein